VISNKEVDSVIAIMGQPEDYILEEEDNKNQSYQAEPRIHYKKTKKLYRDIDTNILGGVAAGLGHFLGVDAIWIRLLLIVLLIGSAGTMTFVYLIFWILLPAAITTSERLEMRGEPVNLSNIEKKVREGFDRVSEEVQNLDYDKFGRQAKSGAEKIASSMSEILSKILHVIAKIIGAFIVIIAITSLSSLIIGAFTFGTTSMFFMPWHTQVDAVLAAGFPLWLLILLSTMAIGIPFFFLMLLGLKLLVDNMKSIGKIAKYTLLALWIISVITLISFGIKQATESAFDGKTIEKTNLNITQNDTLIMKMSYNEFYAKGMDYWTSLDFIQDENGHEFLYSNRIKIQVLYTDETQPYLQIEKFSEGRTFSDARKRAEKIIYRYEITKNKIIFDNYLLTEVTNKSRKQKVNIKLYLPNGFKVMPDVSMKNNDYYFADQMQNNLLWHKKAYHNKVYEMKLASLACANCEDINQEVNKIESTETTVLSINSEGVVVKTSRNNTTQDNVFDHSEVNQNGIIIKTKNND
jgi:phage shock protein PspC (stress-responsive transcriptional regulator)/sRNA-binding regulator protein Hfq/phage pi2 protein 07